MFINAMAKSTSAWCATLSPIAPAPRCATWPRRWLSRDVIDRAAKSLDTHSVAKAIGLLAEEIRLVVRPDLSQGSPALPWPLLAELLTQIDGVPRHLSIHVGGLLITAAPLVEVVPLERATMPGRWWSSGTRTASRMPG